MDIVRESQKQPVFNQQSGMHQCLLNAIGNTPLVKVPFNIPGQLFAKLEYLNPSGSIKDRSALFMIEEAERTGKLNPVALLLKHHRATKAQQQQ